MWYFLTVYVAGFIATYFLVYRKCDKQDRAWAALALIVWPIIIMLVIMDFVETIIKKLYRFFKDIYDECSDGRD